MGFKTDILQVEEIISDSTIVLETLTTEGTTLTLNNITTPTDVNASGGGITLKGTTDKTILWDDTNDNWTSNQSFNIATGLDYKINNVSVLNATTLGANVVNSSLTSLGTIASLVATTADINAGTIDNTSIGATTPNTIVGTYITSIVAGTVKAITDLITLTNSGNASDMDGTGTGILFNQYYYDAGTPALADSGRIAVITETDWTSTGTTQDSYMSFQTALDGTVAEKMRITSNGELLINKIAAPTLSEKLSVIGDTYTTGRIMTSHENLDADGGFYIVRATTRNKILWQDTGDILRLYNVNNSSLVLGTNNTARLTISNGGKVGLSATRNSDSYPYVMELVDNTTAYNGTNPGGGIAFTGNYSSTSQQSIFALIQGIKENVTDGNYAGSLIFTTRAYTSTAVIERMRITSDGKVGIGTTAPANNLEILSTDYTTLRVSTYSTTLATSPNLLFVKSHNATAKTNTTTLTDEVLGYIECYGINSANGAGSAAKISFKQSGTAGASTIPTNILFYTATDSVSLTERMRISSLGNVTITTASNPQITLTDSTAVTSGTVQYNSATESIDFIFS